MIRYECDKCGARMSANDSRRYIVKLEVYAAALPLDLSEADAKDPQREIAEVIEALKTADPDEVEDQTYRSFRFDVCDACRKILLAKPLG